MWSRLEGRLQREPKDDTQANNYSSKPITVLKPVSIKDTPLLQHHNLVFNLQGSLSHKKFEDSTTMVEGEIIQTLKNP